MRRSAAILCGLALLAAFSPASAQAPAYFSVIDYHIDPGMIPQFQAALPKLWPSFKAAGVSTPIFVNTSPADPTTLTMVAPLASLAELDGLRAAVAKAVASVPPELGSQLMPAILSQDQAIWQNRPDLAYTPAKPRLQDSEVGYTRIAILRPKAGQGPALEAALKEASALRKKHGLATGTGAGQLAIGADGPAYAVLLDGKDEVDFLTQNAKETAAMGADWEAYLNKVRPLLRDVEFLSSVPVPTLNYTP